MNRIIDKYPRTEDFVIEVIKNFPAITDEKEKIGITYLAYQLYEKFKYNPYRKDEKTFYREFFANMRESLNEMKKNGKIDEIYNEAKLKDNSIADLIKSVK